MSAVVVAALSGGTSRFARFDVFALIAVARGVSRLPSSPRLCSSHSSAAWSDERIERNCSLHSVKRSLVGHHALRVLTFLH